MSQKCTYISYTYTNPGFRLPSLKSAWDLVYPGQNCDVREILRNLIGCLENWESNNDYLRKSTPWIFIIYSFIYFGIFKIIQRYLKVFPIFKRRNKALNQRQYTSLGVLIFSGESFFFFFFLGYLII